MKLFFWAYSETPSVSDVSVATSEKINWIDLILYKSDFTAKLIYVNNNISFIRTKSSVIQT